MNRVLYRFSPLALVAVLAAAGCGSPEGAADQLPTYDVTARVTLDGKPYGGSQLTMTPADLAAGLPNSGASLGEDGTAKFSTYGPGDGIPAGTYKAGLMYDTLNVKPVPQVKPLTVTITEDMDGGEVAIAFESTGKMQGTPLPPP